MATLEIDAVREVQAQFDEALRRIGDRALLTHRNSPVLIVSVMLMPE